MIWTNFRRFSAARVIIVWYILPVEPPFLLPFLLIETPKAPCLRPFPATNAGPSAALPDPPEVTTAVAVAALAALAAAVAVAAVAQPKTAVQIEERRGGNGCDKLWRCRGMVEMDTDGWGWKYGGKDW